MKDSEICAAKRRAPKMIIALIVVLMAVLFGLISLANVKYQDARIRTRTSEGLFLGDTIRQSVEDAYQSGGMAGMAALSKDVAVQSRYVDNVAVNPADGVITITFDVAIPNQNMSLSGFFASSLADANQLTLTPSIDGKRVTIDGLSGKMNWACASATHETATANGLPYTMPAHPLSRGRVSFCR